MASAALFALLLSLSLAAVAEPGQPFQVKFSPPVLISNTSERCASAGGTDARLPPPIGCPCLLHTSDAAGPLTSGLMSMPPYGSLLLPSVQP